MLSGIHNIPSLWVSRERLRVGGRSHQYSTERQIFINSFRPDSRPWLRWSTWSADATGYVPRSWVSREPWPYVINHDCIVVTVHPCHLMRGRTWQLIEKEETFVGSLMDQLGILVENSDQCMDECLERALRGIRENAFLHRWNVQQGTC